MFSSEDNREVLVVDRKDVMLLWMTKVSLGIVGSSVQQQCVLCRDILVLGFPTENCGAVCYSFNC